MTELIRWHDHARSQNPLSWEKTPIAREKPHRSRVRLAQRTRKCFNGLPSGILAVWSLHRRRLGVQRCEGNTQQRILPPIQAHAAPAQFGQRAERGGLSRPKLGLSDVCWSTAHVRPGGGGEAGLSPVWQCALAIFAPVRLSRFSTVARWITSGGYALVLTLSFF